MDIFKFRNPTAPTKMEQGEIINGFTSKTWIERYRDAGEFTLKGPVTLGLREQLPLGTFISHTNTDEIMIVENHEISEDTNTDSDSEIVITGRGYETFLENRAIGSNNIFPMASGDLSFPLLSDYTWNQARNLIFGHIDPSELDDISDSLPFVTVLASVIPTGGELSPQDRNIKQGFLYPALIDLLKVDNLGIKVIRPSSTSPLGSTNPNVAFVIHKGIDRSKSVAFSYETGEIVTADYLWSNKKYKNAALVSGKFVQTIATLGFSGYAKRWMFIDGSDIDGSLQEAPSGYELLVMGSIMQQRAIDALRSQKELALTKAQVSKEFTRAIYRQDFNVGDIIVVNGDYNEAAPMRVSEYVEIEDETGDSGYPTLSGE